MSRYPKGIKDGQKIRLKGQGGTGYGGGESGDLYIKLEIAQDRLFRVEEANVYLDLPIAPWEAVLGAQIKVPTPTGNVSLKIPPGSGQGNKLRLKGNGNSFKSAWRPIHCAKHCSSTSFR